MNFRKRVLVAILLTTSSASLMYFLCYWQRPNDPIYEGMPLSYWVEHMGPAYPPSTRKEANVTIHSIGTNAIPLFIKYLSETKTSPVFILRAYSFKLINHSDLPDPLFRRLQAVAGFEALGQTGKPAIHRLAELMSKKDLAYDAARALGALKTEDVLPIFDSYLNDPDPKLRSAAAAGLGSLGIAARSRIAILINLANTDKNEIVRVDSVEAVARIGPADIVIPILLAKLRNDNSQQVRSCAAYALSFFPDKTNLFESALLRAAQDSSSELRVGATIALQRIKAAGSTQSTLPEP